MHKHLSAARISKYDEYYTQIKDVEDEVKHYAPWLKGKAVYCPFDSYDSAFTRFFTDNYHKLELKGLRCSSLNGTLYEYDGVKTIIRQTDGDFRSASCRGFFQECDVVITNPPYSKFREFFWLLTRYHKDYLVLGNKIALSYKEVFPEFKNGYCRIGYTMPSEFNTPFGTVTLSRLSQWYTSLPTPGKKSWRATKSIANYEYEWFDNYPARNIDRVDDIPCDYLGLMGVPITAINGFDYSNYEIIDLIARYAIINHGFNVRGKQLTEVDGHPRFSRLIIIKKVKE